MSTKDKPHYSEFNIKINTIEDWERVFVGYIRDHPALDDFNIQGSAIADETRIHESYAKRIRLKFVSERLRNAILKVLGKCDSKIYKARRRFKGYKLCRCSGDDRFELIDALLSAGIFCAAPMIEFFAQHRPKACPIREFFSKRTLAVLEAAQYIASSEQSPLINADDSNDAAEPRVDIVIDRFDDDDPDDSPSFNVMPLDAPDDDDEMVDVATAPIANTKAVVKMFTPTPQLLLPAPSVNINFNSIDTAKNTAATVNILKDARIALELADFKARLDRITNNFNIGIAALDEFQTFAPRSHKGAIVKPKRQRLTGRRRKKTNAEQLKSLATPLIKQIAAISAEFQRDNTASNC